MLWSLYIPARDKSAKGVGPNRTVRLKTGPTASPVSPKCCTVTAHLKMHAGWTWTRTWTILSAATNCRGFQEDGMNSHHSRSSLTLSLPAIVLLTVAAIFTGRGLAQQQSSVQDNPWTFSEEATLTSKYMWRGQRLTNDWSLQPAATVDRATCTCS